MSQQVIPPRFRKPEKYKQIIAPRPRANYQIDIGDLHSLLTFIPNIARYFLVCIDVYSRFCKARAMINRSYDSIIKAIRELFVRMSYPDTVTADAEFIKLNKLNDIFAQSDIDFIPVHPWEKGKKGIVERVIATLKILIVKYIQQYGEPLVKDPREKLQIILDACCDYYNHSYHSVIKARPIFVWKGLDTNHRDFEEIDYEQYPTGTLVLKAPEVGSKSKFIKRAITFDPEIYIVTRSGVGHEIKSLYTGKKYKGVRYWLLKPITPEEAYDIAITPVNVDLMKKRLVSQMKLTPTQAQRRIESVQERPDSMRDLAKED